MPIEFEVKPLAAAKRKTDKNLHSCRFSKTLPILPIE